jgi:hypothetical protein
MSDDKKSVETEEVEDSTAQPQDITDEKLKEANDLIREQWTKEGIPQEYTELAAHFRRLAQDPTFIKKFVSKIVNEMEG